MVRLALFLLALALAGCAGREGQVLRRFTLHAERRTEPVELPVHISGLPNRVFDYRLTADVPLDPDLRGKDVDLVVPYLPAPVALSVSGKEIQPTFRGDPGVGYRVVGPHRFTIPGSLLSDGHASIELRVSHVWTQSGWVDVPPRLVHVGEITPVVARNRALNERGGWFGLVGLSQMGLAFLAVYIWDRRQRAYFWFAIQALTASYYPAYVLGLTVVLGPKLEHLFLAHSLSVATIVSVFFTHEFFNRGKPHFLWLVLMVVGLVVPLPELFHDFVDASYGTPGVILCVAATIAYQLRTGFILRSGGAFRSEGLFFLLCWLALGGSAWVDLWAWMGGGEILGGARPACIGLGFFGLFQSILLSRSHVRSLAEADELNQALRGQLRDIEERKAEIETLNEELRQQVGRRSAHILAALANTDGGTAAVPLEPGDVVEDRYRVIGALGAGGMGTVYEVERLHDKRRLALKVTLETQGLALARLAREAQIATRVRHPNVVAVVDTDVARDGYVYLVMELVEGCSLADFEGRHDVRWCLRVLVQILEGLRALHAQGIVHRDLKPGNVLLTGDVEDAPEVKITDFGISRGPVEDTPDAVLPRSNDPATVRMSPRALALPDATDSDVGASPGPLQPSTPSNSPQLTRTGAIAGTPSYVAPELATRGAVLSPSVDVFSFGVVAYRLLTGSPPHGEAPLLARLDGRRPLPHVPLVVPTLPIGAARALDRCLSFIPEERPDTMDLLHLLRNAIEDTKPDVRAPGPA